MSITFHELPSSRSEQHSFQGLRLAFEVGLKMASHDSLEGVCDDWRALYKESLPFKSHGSREDRHLHHIYLDFQSEFNFFQLRINDEMLTIAS